MFGASDSGARAGGLIAGRAMSLYLSANGNLSLGAIVCNGNLCIYDHFLASHVSYSLSISAGVSSGSILVVVG